MLKNNQESMSSQHTPNGSSVPGIWNDTDISYPLHKTLHQLFEEQVERTPDAIAVIFKSQPISYTELNSYANQLANYLLQNGVRKESLVGVCFNRCFEMVIALLAILKAGGAYVPIDPDYPDERRSFIIKDANLTLTLSHDSTKDKSAGDSKVIIYHRDSPLYKSQDNSNVTINVPSDNAAYVIYTSGSTGIPKGVINIHSGIVNRLLWMQDCFGLSPDDCVLQKTPYSFDVSVWEFFWPLICGAKLVIAEPGGHRDSDYLIDIIQKNNISTLHFVPSMLRLFLDSDRLTNFPSLKRVICSGEALPYVLQELFFNRINCRLFNLYGPTEASVDVTWWECVRNDNRKTVPIGKPISNTQIYILNEKMEKIPIGNEGELYIGGVGVARGYLNRPELTNDRFIADPFSNRKNACLYKTGDLCRYLEDGAIDYLGRIDDQVKVHGFRIEPTEIEVALLNFRAIRAVTVIAKHDPQTSDTKIIAYIVTDMDFIPVNELRNHLLSTLPDFMVPAQFVKISQIPLLNNGKVDKKSLPEPPVDRPQLLQEFIQPSTETEKNIARIWTLHLKIDPVGVNDNFFDIGGNSIIAAIIADSLEKHYKKSIPAVALFQYPTVNAIAKYIETYQSEDNSKFKDAQSRIEKQKNMIRNQKWLSKK